MINNPLRPAWAALLVLGGCSAAHAGQNDPLQGVVEFDDRVIGFEIGGRVLEMAVDRGDQVEAGQLLAKLDDGLERPNRDLRAAQLAAAEAQLQLLRKGARTEDLRASEAEIAALRAQEQTLAKNLERQTRLQAAGAAPAATVDDLSAELKSTSERRIALEQRFKAQRSGARNEEIAAADAETRAAAASLAAIDARLERYTLESPIQASVVDLHVKSGEIVAAGAPAVTLADLAHPYVDVFVPQARMPEIKLGAPVELRVDGADHAFRAHVEHIFPNTEFTPRFLFSESERPNLVVRVRIRAEDPRSELHQGVPAFVRPAVKER